ncbi:MAG: tRNA pseudouridine(38-40) synthase TruA [Proteobacteria bacterium]|nr:MAG: tRNA pseudouridine(38-40) synthase TruA [Pseudomonadota bacterium]PIE18220.1 MAG: tRNA pseudouridine(38-40) synthase TruA [Pseudomonadota bacterium]
MPPDRRGQPSEQAARNLRLVVAYDGSTYCGWQRQPRVPTVQGTIEAALAQLTQAPVSLRGAGRTDAGVHAEGQVANFYSDSALSSHRLLKGLNALLPAPIAVRSVEDVSLDFDARRDNEGKHYRYQLYRPQHRDTERVRRAWHVFGELDLEAMARAGQALVGRHDFAAFRAADCERETTVRTLYRVGLRQRGELLLIDVEGTAFLKNMVRIIAGTLVDIGRGRLPEGRAHELLASGDRTAGGVTAPAAGLTLQRVYLR